MKTNPKKPNRSSELSPGGSGSTGLPALLALAKEKGNYMKSPWCMRQKPAVALIAALGSLLTIVDPTCAQLWATTTAPDIQWKAL
jgi:hypothetical protein